ncbi:MerR family transcriptional regulator [Gaiella sp.]|jgi:MerR family transcriptional regulator, light-induced transcriptional regulator|uniref:MerR family transcriptional regulator n=1 Tax=Gaiella sp. TaxID=2663207 RepID=UPI002BF67B5B|nr:B12-binding domain-containing protein [Gaiella sp.]HWO81168.1 B12-binding domain-containing protein [Gaiella sp.]
MTDLPAAADDKLLRIGELSRRVGVPVESLRAWERRYGLLDPSRTQGGFRLYGEDDVARVLAMRANLERGLFAAEAARLALADDVGDEPAAPGPVVDADELAAALDRFDEAGAQRALDSLLAALTLDVVLRDVLLPYLHELGERWERGEVSVAQEHFASNLIRGRLMSLARSWDRGMGPRALLACVEGERHDLPLVCFGLALRGHGWRISYLGADTPIASLAEALRTLAPDAVVVSGTVRGAFGATATKLRKIALDAPLFVAGAAADEAVARRVRGTLLSGDPVVAAETLARVRHPQ